MAPSRRLKCCIGVQVALTEASASLQVDSDGGAADLLVLVSQLFDFLIALAGNPRFEQTLLESVPQLIHQTLGDLFPLPILVDNTLMDLVHLQSPSLKTQT